MKTLHPWLFLSTCILLWMANDLYMNIDVYFKSLLLKESIAAYVMQNRKTAR